MTGSLRNIVLFSAVAMLFVATGVMQSWSLALALLNLSLISAVMALGVNIQWGYAGLFNVGTMGFAALGGVAGVLISTPPVMEAWSAGGGGIIISLVILLATIGLCVYVARLLGKAHPLRLWAVLLVAIIGYFCARYFFDDAIIAIEAVEPAKTGFLGGMGLPILFAWLAGGVLAAGAAWIVGKIALGLRSDYLAIATLGISEIIVAMLKNEDWLTRGVKNVTGLPRPVPYETELQAAAWFQDLAQSLGLNVVDFSTIFVKLCYAALFAIVLIAIMWLSERALQSPWGRMMRAIRDNETAANAMGKNVTARHLQVFVLGSAVIGIAGAMLTTIDGQFTPASYQPLRFTFLIWVMVIVGGSGNNWGAILGGFVIWFFWVQAEPIGLWLMQTITAGMAADSPLRAHLIENAAHMRLMTMGLILLLVLRFYPRGLIPERRR